MVQTQQTKGGVAFLLLVLTSCVHFATGRHALLNRIRLHAPARPSTVTQSSSWIVLSYDSFEDDYGTWKDGGNDSTRHNDVEKASHGSHSVRLRDNTSTSTITSKSNLKISGYNQIRVAFSFYVESMESGEDFFLDVSSDGGSSWKAVKSWERTTTLSNSNPPISPISNDQRYEDEVIIDSTNYPASQFTDSTLLRFRMSASGDGDKIYLDEVQVAVAAPTTEVSWTTPKVSMLYEAEHYTEQLYCSLKADHPGYSGAGFMDFGPAESYIEWNNIEVLNYGAHLIRIRYACGDQNGRESRIIIQGIEVDTRPLAFTGGWVDWGDESLVVSLEKGPNTVRIQSIGNGPNVDYIEITPQTDSPSVIKTTLVSSSKAGTVFDELNGSSVTMIRAATGHEIDGIQFVYSSGDGGYFGRHAAGDDYPLLADEEIIRIDCKEHEGDFGMEFVKFVTSNNRSVDIITGGSDGGGGAEKTFLVPDGYHLGGIHGVAGGTYGNTVITVGFYWVRTATASPTLSPSPTMTPTVSSMPSMSSMPSFIEVIDSTTLNGKIMAGYQGWFCTPGDGTGVGWRHWSERGEAPNAETVQVDMWPDLREYDSDELAPTDFSYRDDSNAGLFSSHNPKTVRRHVQWMHQYGIDGVFVQRFVSEAISITAQRDQVLDNVRQASEDFGRVFANMYDLDTVPSLKETLISDWKHLVDDLNITSSPNYLHHKGRPVLAMWGWDLSSRNHNITVAHEVIDWFTGAAEEKYRVTLMGGVMTMWRDIDKWKDVYPRFDIISPWAVGRISSISEADTFRADYVDPDLNHLNGTNIDYLPVVFPGFSWFNLKDSVLNEIPRRGGRFLWRQLFNVMDAGAKMIYVAMYDEVDEGTAIFKTTEKAEQNPTTGTFLTLDADGEAISSDWYLYLVGEATRLFRTGSAIDENLPNRP